LWRAEPYRVPTEITELRRLYFEADQEQQKNDAELGELLQRVNRSRGKIAHLPDNKARDQEGNY